MQTLIGTAVPVYPAYTALLKTPRAFWVGDGAGLAEYTNANFVSQGTNFRMQGGVARPNTNYASPVPSASPSQSFSVQDLLGQPVPPGVALACNYDLANCFVDFYSNSVADGLTQASPTTNERASSFSVLDQDLQGSGATVQIVDPTTGLTYSTERVFSLNRFNFAAAHSYLIPKAVGYSAGLINYFFRGRMEITLPDEGIYSIVDHAIADGNDPASGGFEKIKLKVRNLTPTLNQGNPAIEAMSGGYLYLIAKFRRNPCYRADLGGELGSSGVNCTRPTEEQIVVATPVAVPSEVNSGWHPIEFIFPSKIPISATDLHLQLVYRGQLGDEPDAVVVETKDISEPHYLYNYSRWDQYKYAGYPSTASGPNSWAQWCAQGGYPTLAVCNADHGLTYRLFYRPDPAPFAGYDPANAMVPQGTWSDIANKPAHGEAVAVLTAPVGTLARVAVLTERSPTNRFLWIAEWIDSTKGVSLFQWSTSIASTTINQLDFGATSPTITTSYLPGRGVFLPSVESVLLNGGTADLIPPLILTPSQPRF